MKLIAKANGGGDRPLPPKGMQQAVLYSVIELGTHKTEYMGKEKIQRKINVAWELPFVPKLKYEDDGQTIERPQCIFRSYTLSLYEKAKLAEHLSGWRGEKFTKAEENGFNIFSMLQPNTNVLLNVVHYEGNDGKVRARYESISPLMPNMNETLPENPTIFYCIAECGDNFPEGMPEWCVEEIKKSPEYKRKMFSNDITNDQGSAEVVSQNYATDGQAEAAQSDEIPF